MELNLVQQVESKLLLADSDAKFNAALDIFLVPLIQKMTSTNVEVVRKVVEVLHLVKQKKHNSADVVFPVEKLMAMYEQSVLGSEYATPGIVRQNKQLLSFIGNEMLSYKENSKKSMPPIRLVRGLRNARDFSTDVKEVAGEQFSSFLSASNQFENELDHIDLSSQDPLDLEVLQTKLAQLFLLDLRHCSLSGQPGGLSQADTEFFTKHGEKIGITFPLQNDLGISTTRKNALKLAVAQSDLFKHVLVAAMGDPMLDISRQARSEASKLNGYDSRILQDWALTGSINLRLEVVESMIRKKLIQDSNPEIVLSALTETGNSRSRQSASQLLQELSTQSHEKLAWSQEIKERFHKALYQYIVDDGWPRSQVHSAVQTRLRQQCYELLGEFNNSQATLTFLFQSLERDSPEMSASIQKSLTKVLDSTNGEQVDAQKLLGYMERSQNHRTRYAALRFAISKLEPTNPSQRIICLLGIDNHKNRPDAVLEAQRGLISSTSSDELPSFSAILPAIQQLLYQGKLASEIEVDYSLLFLLSCLSRRPPSSMEWTNEMTAALSMSNSPLMTDTNYSKEDLTQFATFLFSIIEHKSAVYYKLITLLLERAIAILPEVSLRGLANPDSLVQLLENESNGYGPFVAEYLPVLSPETEVTGESHLTILAQAFRAAKLNAASPKVNELALETENIDAILVLAASNMIDADTILSNDKLHALFKKNQLAQASLTVNASLELRKKILGDLLKFTSRSFDDIVANGEAVSVATSGWNSRVLQEKYPTSSKDRRHSSGPKVWDLEDTASKAVTAGIKGSPESRRIACIRLLCLTQYSFYNIDDYVGIVGGIQTCFMSLLTDSDDVTQESAGKGLEILFDSSSNNKTVQNELLSTSVSSFTDETSAKKFTAGTLTEDTQIFEPGSLPSEPQGGSKGISTYKDVMNLANETGDSSLVYKFMSLSSSSKIWAGRKGMAFSLQQISSKSELATQIFEGSDLGRRLIPKLFRYLYDPVEVTKMAMKNIWLALIPSSKRSAVIKLYFPEISEQVFAGVVEREWRVRQASTLASSDSVSQGLIGDSLDVWKAGFRAVDDIKESVSKAGSELLHTLTNSLVRAFSAGRSPDISEILPFLLKGLNNESTSKYSLDTILKLSETQGFKPYAAEVVEELSIHLSSIEPQALNYFALNTNQQMVDEVRAQGLRASPVMQGLEGMVERGAPSTDELWTILPRIVKKSVGVSSKLAGARLIVLTSMMSYGESKPATEALLNACMAELFGNNDLVAEQYASALAYVCRKLPLALVLKYVTLLRETYAKTESDDFRTRKIIAKALSNLSDNAADVYSSVNSTVLPLIFVGTCLDFDEDKKTATIFRKVWDNNAGGEASLRLYRSELMEFCVDLLSNSTARSLKIAAGNAIEKAIPRDQRLSISDPISVTNALLNNSSGRSWPGKEHIFGALIAVYPSVEDKELRKITEERILNEIQRKNVEYKTNILPSVVRFLEESSVHSEEIIKSIKSSAIEAALEVCDDDHDSKVSTCKTAMKSRDLRVFEHALSLDSWKYRIAACEAAIEIPFDSAIWSLLTEKCANDENYERVRLAWSHAALKFRDHDIVITDAKERLAKEPSSIVKQELSQIV